MRINLIAPARKPEWGESFWDLKSLCHFTGMRAGCAPLALPTLAALTPSDIEVRIVDENVEPIDFNGEVDIVGITFFTSLAPRAYEVADEFRKRGVPVILGGIHASMLPDEAIQHADSVVIGEAEHLWAQVVNDARRRKLQKFYRASAFPSLEDSPRPRWDLLKTEDYAFFTLQAGRGCPNGCNFCSVTVFNGHKHRQKSIEKVAKEIAFLQELDARKTIFFVDDNILADLVYAKRLFKVLASMNVKWWCQASIDRLEDDRLLDLMYKGGCREVFVGFESISQQSLSLMNKSKINRVEEYKNAIATIHEHGIAVFASFMLGSDADDQSTFEATAQFIEETDIPFSMVNILTPVPGTALYKKFDSEERLMCDDWGKYDGESVCFRPKQLSVQELQAGRLMVLQSIYSYKSLYRRLRELWKCRVFVRNRYERTPLFSKSRVLFTIRSLFFPDVRRTWFILKSLWQPRATSIMAILIGLNFHDYASSLGRRDDGMGVR